MGIRGGFVRISYARRVGGLFLVACSVLLRPDSAQDFSYLSLTTTF